MAQTHTPALEVDYGIRSRAHWSLNPTGHVLLFVHGFNGHATGTWIDFPGQMMIHPKVAGCDMVFYGYRSGHRADTSARTLLEFMEALVDPSGRLANSSLLNRGFAERKNGQKEIKRLTIVAHSLGACVSRRALILHALNNRKTWPVPVQMILFAPAHKGAKLLPLVIESLLSIPYGGLGAAGLRFLVPVFKDLVEGCDFLRDLHTETLEAIEKRHTHLRAEAVYAAGHDLVVEDCTFARDPSAKDIRGTTHTSVCKPNLVVSRPALELLKFV